MRKTWRRIFWCLAGLPSVCWLGGTAWGQAELVAPQYPQYVQYPQGAPPVTPAVAGAQVNLAAYQLDQLLGPIALYPDPLLSMVFPASTYPQEVVASEEWLQSTPDLTEAAIAAQSWDGSIKGLVHYPTVLKMMSDRIDWTQAVGAAFVNQQKDVLNSVQRLRAQAQAAQNLQTTAQEQVLADGNDIRIEPVDPDTMYVPQYDPNLVYSSPYAIGIFVDAGVVRDDQYAAVLVEDFLLDEGDDHLARLAIEGGGGFIENQYLRAAADGTRDGDTLLLASGELDGKNTATAPEADDVKIPVGLSDGLVPVALFEDHRDGDVLRGGQPREQMIVLKHKPYGIQSEIRQLVIAQGPDVDSIDDDGAGVGAQDAGNHAQKRGLAAAGGPDDEQHFAKVGD